MIEIIAAIGIGLVLGVINAAAGTAYGLSKSNIVGGEEGSVSDFIKDGRGVYFHEKGVKKKSL